MFKLTDIYRQIEAKVLSNVGAAGGRPPSFGIGVRDVTDHYARVTATSNHAHVSWVPMGGQVQTPRAAGVRTPPTVRKLWARSFATSAYIWAPDVDAAHELANHLVASIDDARLHGSYKVTQERWDVSGDVQAGNVVVIIFEIELPFTSEPLKSVRPNAAAITPEIAQPEDQ